MHRNEVFFQVVLSFLTRNGGHATLKQIYAETVRTGYSVGKGNINARIKPLLEDGRLVRSGHSMYWTREAFDANEKLRTIAALPHGTRLKGSILYYMLDHRYVRPAEVFAVFKGKLAKNVETVYTAFTELRKEGWVHRPAPTVYTLTQKALDAAKRTDVTDVTPFTGPWGPTVRPIILHILAEHGPIRLAHLTTALRRKGYPVTYFQVDAALRPLRKAGQVERRSTGIYAVPDPVRKVAPAKHAAAATAS